MTIPVWPEGLDDIWAKSISRSEGGKPESLALHTWNVLERLAETIRLRPKLPEQIGFPGLWNCLFWACFLHDFGKSAKGFQDMLRDGARWPHRHEVLSLTFLDWVRSALSAEEILWVAAAIISHHKDAQDIQLAYSERSDPDNQLLAKRVAEINDNTLINLRKWLDKCQTAWIENLGLKDMGISLAILPSETEALSAVKNQGAANIRSFLNSYQQWIKKINRSEEQALVIGTIALRGYIISSDHLASAHTGELPPSRLANPKDC
jgi:CRISPR-associated endonuclease/helicase Cas3